MASLPHLINSEPADESNSDDIYFDPLPPGPYSYRFSENTHRFLAVPWETSQHHMNGKDAATIAYTEIMESEKRYSERCRSEESARDIKSRMEDFANEKFKALIYFSNRVEDTGLIESETYKLLDQVYKNGVHSIIDILAAYDRNSGQIPFRSAPSTRYVPESAVLPVTLTPTWEETPPSSPKTMKDALGRLEVLQHAAAYHYLCVVNVRKPLSVSLILETHRILMDTIMPVNEETGKPFPAGQYRKFPVYAGTHVFPPHTCVRNAVAGLVDQYEYFRFQRQDPFSLAAFLCYDFVTIHPFMDGNGRMCRLLMNYVLLHHGIPFPVPFGFGVRSKARGHYLYAIQQARKHNGNHGQLSMIVLTAVQEGWSAFFENIRVTSTSNRRKPRRQETKNKE